MLFVIWRSTNPEPIAAGKEVGGSLDVISLQIDILSLTMASLGIGLGVIALFGYQALKEAAEARAEAVAREVAAKKADEVATSTYAKHIENLSQANVGLSRAPIGQATINPDDVTEDNEKEDGHVRDS